MSESRYALFDDVKDGVKLRHVVGQGRSLYQTDLPTGRNVMTVKVGRLIPRNHAEALKREQWENNVSRSERIKRRETLQELGLLHTKS